MPGAQTSPDSLIRNAAEFRVAELRRLFLAALALVAILWFGTLNYRGLFIPDEGRYAEIPREMLASGDWITPRLDGLKYFEKPPLQYWATAASFALFGEHDWSARLWPALTGFLAALLLVFAGNRLGPPGAGWLAGTMLASSWGYLLAGQFLTLDMGVSAFLTLALCAFLLAQDRPRSEAARRNWMILAWAAMALAVLSKGLIGIVLPGLVLALYILLQRDWRLLGRLHWGPGLAVFGAIAAPWFVLVQLRNPEFFRFFFIHEHFERFATAEAHRAGPWWYFVPILLLGMMPWTAALPGALRRAWSAAGAKGGFDADRLLLVWAAVIFAFFSLSHSKLPGYVIPVMPALALLLARDATRGARLPLGALSAAALVLGAALAMLAPRLPSLPHAPALAALLGAYWRWLLAAGALLAVGAALTWRAQAARAPVLAVLVLGFAGLGSALTALDGLHRIEDNYSAQSFAERLVGKDRRLAPQDRVYSLRQFDSSLSFYLGSEMTLVGYRGELAPGIAADPHMYIASLPEFAERWVEEREAYAVMSPELYRTLSEQGLPMHLVLADGRRVLVSRSGTPPENLPRAGSLLLALAHHVAHRPRN
ncbi:MAG TPA: phospholipid carrier-dependent glycosyltransferase [Burkholderiales bacterium]|nr:phospholipid carrier-dependent glycosyltransferase [Burkholderiales bacterium]